jgi:hypothetical protein
MFTGLKNKIREETGNDPTKLAISTPPQKITHGSTPKGRHSRQGSGSSLGSLPPDGVWEELAPSPSVLKQDSSEIKLVDGRVRSVLLFKINGYDFFGGNKLATFCHSIHCCSLYVV